jgi:hypothetical protein
MSNRILIVENAATGAAEIKSLTPQTSIADASVAHALNATFSDTEAEAALNALGVKINAILAVLDTAGITA